MVAPKVFIDGQAGTTGLRIREMLATRPDLELLAIPDAERKDASARREFLRRADVAILCLPDDAVPEAVEMVEGAATRLIDVSSARRIDPGWTYGLPELSPGQREAIRTSARVSNPGCYPTGFILAIRPLVDAGLLLPDAPLSVYGYSGYSGGGRKMIEEYQAAPRDAASGDAALPISLYRLSGGHKHLPEMTKFAGLSSPPVFVPCVGQFYCGMLVSVAIPPSLWQRDVSAQDVRGVLAERYENEPFVRVMPPGDAAALRSGKYLEPLACNHSNRLELFLFGKPGEGAVLVARLDNLGKGASGNAVQCLNLMLDFPETAGLE